MGGASEAGEAGDWGGDHSGVSDGSGRDKSCWVTPDSVRVRRNRGRDVAGISALRQQRDEMMRAVAMPKSFKPAEEVRESANRASSSKCSSTSWTKSS